ncbi:MAG: peptidoglycan editing factor PgeF [Lachnospiraceae bacterium]|nr:peptidoglycan editing factor PgeF [Lachnospiraceae bacterium]
MEKTGTKQRIQVLGLSEGEVLQLWEKARTEECYLEHADSVPIIRFHAFDKLGFVNAAFSTRYGGVSTGYFAELNLGFNRGDSEENVTQNYCLFCKSMGVSTENLVLSDQVHKTEIAIATKEDTCKGKIKKKLKGIDGLITDKENICLATSYADCVPLFFADPAKRVIAASHAGWRGTVEKMGQKTVNQMQEQFGCNKQDIIAVIGPSICQSCYEVSQDVAEAFAKQYTKEQMEKIMLCSNAAEKKYQLDLWQANALQLKDAGLLAENIHISGICTCCNSRLLFSHRASHGKRGNLNGFIQIAAVSSVQ